MPLEDRVCALIAEFFQLPRARVTIDSTRQTITGWDSMAILNLAVEIETTFDQQLAAEEIAELVGVKQIVALLERKSC